MAEAPEKTPATPRQSQLAMLGGIVLVAGLLRIWAAEGDLWIDEVWSLYNVALALTTATAADWAPLFFHTNTHPLNTLYMAVLGLDATVFAYRLPSIISGIGMVVLAAAIGWRRSPREGLIAAALIALSYPMVHYSAEARGYAPMLLAALAAYTLLETWLENPSPGRAAGFVLVCLLGFAFHQSFLAVEAGLGLWAAAVLFRRLGAVVPTLARLVLLFGLQAVAVTAYGVVALGNLVFGGRVMLPVTDSVGVMAKVAFGIDPAFPVSPAPVLVLALLLAGAIWAARRRGDLTWIFFGFVVLAFPLGYVLFGGGTITTPRYFLPSAVFALIAAARGLSLLMEGNRWTRALVVAALVLFSAGNGLLLEKFFAAGRGHYTDALRHITDATKGEARIAGYQQFTVGMTVNHYAQAQGLAAKVRFVAAAEDTENPAEWFIDGHLFTDPDKDVQAPPGWFIEGSFGKRKPANRIIRHGRTAYRLEAVYPHWGLSGDTWLVYRLSPAAKP